VTGAPPAVSAVIVSYNTRDLLLSCLSSLQSVTLPMETIVVDNASADGSADAARSHVTRPQVIAQSSNLGFGKANNVGIRAAQGRFVLMLNSDAAVRPGCVETLAGVVEGRPEVGVVGPRTLHPDGRAQLSFGPDLTPWNEWRQRRLVRALRRQDPAAQRRVQEMTAREQEPAWLSGACLLARRDLLLRLGGFDEGFFLYEEDVDLCVRIRQAGFKVFFTPQAQVVHHLGRSMATAESRSRQAYRDSHIRFYEKHRGPVDRLLLRLWMSLDRR
jgi:N-acetylglucosaminyl-diphospho-decaprenol L-rhamnosyltransferase